MRLPFNKPYRTLNTIRVSAEALRHNLLHYRALFPGQAICPVLKANAYGHGLVEVARVLDPLKPEFFVVDSLYEAYKLESAGIKSMILVLGYTLPENLEGRRFPFHFAVSDLESARVLAAQGNSVHLKIETGMNRMGFAVKELETVLPIFKEMGLKIEGVLTHLADADNEASDAYTQHQVALFKEAVRVVREVGFDPEWIHAGQSAGAFKVGAVGNMVRVGLGMYGISPFEATDSVVGALSALRPVMEWVSTVVGIRPIKQGDRVGYNGTFVAERDSTLAVVPMGYYEGFPRALSSKGIMEIRGELCPVVGRVCMNYTMIDVSDVPGVNVGDEVTVYSAGGSNGVVSAARLANTIPYELMVRLSESMRREVL